jgi:hypothetical protein
MSFELNDMSLQDTCSENPYNKYILSMQDLNSISNNPRTLNSRPLSTGTKPRSQLLVSSESKVVVDTVKVSSLPLQIFWNDQCLLRVIGIFVPRTDAPILAVTHSSSFSISERNMFLATKKKFAIEAAMTSPSILKLFIEIEAPKVDHLVTEFAGDF